MENKIVDDNEAQKFAAELNAIFQTISAKSGNGIEDLFNQIVNKMMELNLIEKKDSDLTSQENSKKNKSNCCCHLIWGLLFI